MKTPNGKTITLSVSQNESIGMVKYRIGLREGMPHAIDQRLSFQGKELHNALYISDYNIQNESCLDLLVRLKGGQMIMLSCCFCCFLLFVLLFYCFFVFFLC